MADEQPRHEDDEKKEVEKRITEIHWDAHSAILTQL